MWPRVFLFWINRGNPLGTMGAENLVFLKKSLSRSKLPPKKGIDQNWGTYWFALGLHLSNDTQKLNATRVANLTASVGDSLRNFNALGSSEFLAKNERISATFQYLFLEETIHIPMDHFLQHCLFFGLMLASFTNLQETSGGRNEKWTFTRWQRKFSGTFPLNFCQNRVYNSSKNRSQLDFFSKPI